MTSYSAGKEVLSYCGKCKLPLGHTIVAMKDTHTIGKVKCNTCQAVHMYKDPATKSKRAKSSSTTTRKRKKAISVNDLWIEEMGKAAGKSVKYTIRETFEVGDILDHKSFGPGIVQNLVDDKIEVLFQHEIKLLVHGK